MAQIAPAALVAAPPRLQLPYGAFSVLNFREAGLGRWENGITWETLTCEPAGVIEGIDCDFEQVTGFPRDLEKMSAELGVGAPFSVYGHHMCSPIGTPQELATEKAREHLAAREEQGVEAYVQATIETNGSLLTGVTNPWEVVAAIEQHFAATFGGQGVIWTSRRLATLMGDDGDLKSSGGTLKTTLGTPVIAGSGIDDGFIGITGQPVGYRSEILDFSNRPYDLLDRGQNDMLAIAQRNYVVGFELCGLTYASLTLPTITITPPDAE